MAHSLAQTFQSIQCQATQTPGSGASDTGQNFQGPCRTMGEDWRDKGNMKHIL